MAEREIYNPATGEYELINDDGIYETNPYVPVEPEVPEVPNDPQVGIQDVMTNPNSPPPYGVSDGMEWYWNETAARWSTRPKATPPPTSGRGTMDPNNPPTEPPPAGTKWEFDPANGWYPRAIDIPRVGAGPESGGNTNPGQFDGGSEPSGDFAWPSYTAPPFESSGPFVPRRDTLEVTPFTPRRTTFDYQPFAYGDYASPTLEQARENPGYKFAAEEGINRLESSAAGRGTLRSGGTLKDILGWGNKFAEQNYQQVDDRERMNYSTNRNNAFDAYKTNLDTAFRKFGTEFDMDAAVHRTNQDADFRKFDTEYGVDRDRYDRLASDTQSGNNYRFNASQAEFGPRMESAKLTFADQYARWKAKLDAATAIATRGPQ